ncbi:MAG: endonuclease/exonuclease/phosphatase family protein, partial [Novosphingobium sp.]|nr:endonuclease/exonuclease/phosphatase family protein [Novosphingobium sp.]
MQLKFATYNIRKAVGLDRKRDPERILAILHEIGADVVALQEVDRRLGRRETALPRQMVEEQHWQIVPLAIRPLSIGWHGNALLVRRGIDILDSAIVELPRLEPRGAVRVDLGVGGQRVRVVGMH